EPKTKYQGVVKKVYRAFFSPSQYEVKSADREIIESGDSYRVPYESGELAVTTWGEREHPTVLLMHGWGGARAQMTGFVKPLLSAGYRVVAYDQPAHGESDGKMTNILEITPTMDIIKEIEGDFAAIIAHSFGTLITSYALTSRNFPPPSRLVYFGAFNRLLDSLPRFQVLANLPDEIIHGLQEMIYENFGRGVLDAIVNEEMTQQINVPALMFHDVTDNVTPIEDSRAIARAWKNARFVETDGMGHRGALQSKEIHEQVIKFLTS
ncbi:MAG TPA: alpha/beta fold hydrolase, partial [Anaerolineales bacterium]|nr:alpha/beta fold hydrolase [Anaerolineales bacterium]